MSLAVGTSLRRCAALLAPPALLRARVVLPTMSTFVHVVAAASVERPGQRNVQPHSGLPQVSGRYPCDQGDHMTLLNVFEDWAQVDVPHRDAWCAHHGLHARALRAADDVRTQILDLLRACGAEGTRGPEGAPIRPSSAQSRLRCRKALCAGHFIHSARRARGVSAFVTLTEPPQTVQTRQGNGKLLNTASYVVFSELVWIGRLVMQHACAVELEWLQDLLPRLKEPMATGVGGEIARGQIMSLKQKVNTETRALLRRNDETTVAAAQRRFEERRKRLKMAAGSGSDT